MEGLPCGFFSDTSFMPGMFSGDLFAAKQLKGKTGKSGKTGYL